MGLAFNRPLPRSTEEKRRAMVITKVVEIADKHTDQLGFLSHVEAVRLFESARSQWYAACGLYNDQSNVGRRLSSVVVKVSVCYELACCVGEEVTVSTRPDSMGTKSFTLKHQLVKSNGRIAIDGCATSVIMDLTNRVAIAVPTCLAAHLPRC